MVERSLAKWSQLLLVAIFHHVLVQRQNARYSWFSIVALSIGLAFIRTPHTFIGQILTGSKTEIVTAIGLENGWEATLGAFLSVLIVVAAATKSVCTETVLKCETRAFVAQVRTVSKLCRP